MEKTELDYRLELIKLVSYCSTCRKDNADFWMERLRDYLNNVYEILDITGCVMYDGDGLILTLKEGEDAKTKM